MNKKSIIILVGLTLLISSCGVYNSLMNLSKLKFKLGSVNNFKVGNVTINNKSKLSDFAALDILKLTSDVVSGKFPVSFTVNVLAQNPNSASSSGSNLSDMTLESFPWTLYINDKETISGNISNPMKVPAIENTTVIPLEMNLDLLSFFKDDGLNSLINLALSLGGKDGSATKLRIVADPVLGTSLGNLRYPNPITIIDKSFN
ncbi:MAG: hypothetical protein OQJ81_01855 [Melioribacteraceae bacterium]|nr:hypothetical protein [Melioribacteraceae bacterium]